VALGLELCVHQSSQLAYFVWLRGCHILRQARQFLGVCYLCRIHEYVINASILFAGIITTLRVSLPQDVSVGTEVRSDAKNLGAAHDIWGQEIGLLLGRTVW